MMEKNQHSFCKWKLIITNLLHYKEIDELVGVKWLSDSIYWIPPKSFLGKKKRWKYESYI